MLNLRPFKFQFQISPIKKKIQVKLTNIIFSLVTLIFQIQCRVTYLGIYCFVFLSFFKFHHFCKIKLGIFLKTMKGTAEKTSALVFFSQHFSNRVTEFRKLSNSSQTYRFLLSRLLSERL